MIKKIISSVVLGIAAGWFSYFLLMNITQSHLETAILEAKVSFETYKSDPVLASIMTGEDNTKNHQGFRDEFTWRLLQSWGIINSQVENADLSPILKEQIKEVFTSATGSTTGLNLFYNVLIGMGDKPSSESSRQKTLAILAKALAQSPYSKNDYAQLLDSSEYELKSHRFSRGLPPEIFSSAWNGMTIDEVKSVTYTHLQVLNRFKNLKSIEALDEYKQFNEVVTKILIMINNNEEVVSARSWVMLFKGTIQLLIMMTFFIGLFLIMSSVYLTGKGKETFKLVKVLLPIFGFIGTILGLMKSLGNAYKIPMASGNSNTSIAISEITNSLGTAFTTTLLAFMLIIVLDVLALIKFKQQQNV